MTLIVSTLKKNNRLDAINLHLFVVGSRKIYSDDNYDSQWSIFAPNLTIYGFDADEDACNIANNQLKLNNVNWTEKHFPLALSNKIGESTLYVTKGVHCSSLYPPKESFLNRLKDMNYSISLDFAVDIETVTLDQFVKEEKIEKVDFLQIDVQGADLDVLKGAEKILENNILGVKIEVEFTPLYDNQPLFSDIDIYLRNQGFLLFDIITNDGWCRRRRNSSPIFSTKNYGQLLWGDGIYFRDPMIENAHGIMKNPQNILKLACIADTLDYPDYAMELLEYLTINYGDDDQYNFAHEIVEILAQFPELVKNGLDNLPIIQNISHRLKI